MMATWRVGKGNSRFVRCPSCNALFAVAYPPKGPPTPAWIEARASWCHCGVFVEIASLREPAG
jgi:hypothetical protein